MHASPLLRAQRALNQGRPGHDRRRILFGDAHRRAHDHVGNQPVTQTLLAVPLKAEKMTARLRAVGKMIDGLRPTTDLIRQPFALEHKIEGFDILARRR